MTFVRFFLAVADRLGRPHMAVWLGLGPFRAHQGVWRPHLGLKLESKIRLYIISLGDIHASWDPSGSWEFKILQQRGTQVGVGNVGVYRQK